MKIEGVDLISERSTYKVDASGRIIIPAHMRNKFRVDSGDFMEYLPSRSVWAAVFVSFIDMNTPTRGSPSSEKTVPVTLSVFASCEVLLCAFIECAESRKAHKQAMINAILPSLFMAQAKF